MTETYPYLGEKIDGVYTLTDGIGKGGFARVYLAEVNLDTFDYATVVAYREKREKKQAAGIAPSRGQHYEKVEKRLEELRSPEWAEKVKTAVEKVPDFYPYTGTCAVKILEMPSELQGQDRETRIERFEGEWKNLMGITHPNVIRVYGGAKTDLNGRETYYYAMEYLEQILDDEAIIKKRYEEKTDIIKKAALGLKAIQSHQLVHRDVKPDNILVTRIGEVKVTDAGIAKDLMRDSDMTLTQTVIGTPHFESPEQVVGSKNVDFRTDIYSLGGAFYKWLTGVKPYEDNEELTSVMDILYVLRKLHDYATGIERNVYRITLLPADIVLPTPVDELCDIPEKVVDVLEKMMNPDKEIFRHQTMDEVITDLNAILQGDATSIELEKLDVASEKGEKVERRRIEKAKKKKQTAAFAAVGGVLALILIVAAVFILGNKDKGKTGAYNGKEQREEEIPEDKPIPGEQEDVQRARLEVLHKAVILKEEKEPDNLGLLEREWQDLKKQGIGTEYAVIADNKLKEIADKRKKIADEKQKEINAAVADLDGSVRELIMKREFGQALKACSEFQKKEEYGHPEAKRKVVLLQGEIRNEAKKTVDGLVAGAKGLVDKGKFQEARNIIKALGSFGMPEYTALMAKGLARIDKLEQKMAKEKEEEGKVKSRELVSKLKPLIEKRKFRDALRNLDESAKDMPQTVVDEYLKPERIILQAAFVFMTRCRNRAASKPSGLTLKIKGMTGPVSDYDPMSDRITVIFRAEGMSAQASEVVRTLPADTLLILSNWNKPGILSPKEAFAVGCFIVLTDTFSKAGPYLAKAREGGLVNAQLERAFTVRKRGEAEVLAEEKFKQVETNVKRKQWKKVKSLCEDLLANYADTKYLKPHVEKIKTVLGEALFELSPLERYTVVLQQGKSVPEFGIDAYAGTEDTFLCRIVPDQWPPGRSGTAKALGGGGQSPLYKFDVSMIPKDATIEKALFEVNTANFSYGAVEGFVLKVYALTCPWDERTATWSFSMRDRKAGKETRWKEKGGKTDRDTTRDWGNGPNGLVIEFKLKLNKWTGDDIAPLVQEWVSGKRENHGMYFFPESRGLANLYTKEAKDSNVRPKLTITFTSKPLQFLKKNPPQRR
ncbi:protein kinase [Planctomycetota bacterium]